MDVQEIETNASKAVVLLKALANERRLMILCHLLNGEMSVGEMNDKIAMSQSALSQHLAWLRNDNLVATRKEAQTVYYSLCSEEAKSVIEVLHRLYCEV